MKLTPSSNTENRRDSHYLYFPPGRYMSCRQTQQPLSDHLNFCLGCPLPYNRSNFIAEQLTTILGLAVND